MTAATEEFRNTRTEQAEPDGATAMGSTTRMPIDQIKVEDRWAQYFTLSDDEPDLLEKSIEAEGIREPLVVTPERVLLDGHRRLAVARKLGFGDVPVVERKFPDDEAIEVFVITNQLQRRNLTDAQRADLRGRLYNQLKAARGGDHRSKGHGEPLIDAAEMVANASGVSKSTVKRDGRYSRAVDKAAKKGGAKAKAKMLAGKPKRDAVPRIEAADTSEEIDAALLGQPEKAPSSVAESAVPHEDARPESPHSDRSDVGGAWDVGRGWGPNLNRLQGEFTRDWNHADNPGKLVGLLGAVQVIVAHYLDHCRKHKVPNKDREAWLAQVGQAIAALSDFVASACAELQQT